ncbi:hypothetical protein WN55_05327 [Dufourea novaeangliae]|uniref:Uncharacterized protein n=1 Tax=Dufourea novaeangliae TaxID=178035 RepID=A0A154PN97_DUFNO|nr:hypothetical protein WN55_05327 [Dufourea novaeangliae]
MTKMWAAAGALVRGRPKIAPRNGSRKSENSQKKKKKSSADHSHTRRLASEIGY